MRVFIGVQTNAMDEKTRRIFKRKAEGSVDYRENACIADIIADIRKEKI